MTLQIELSSQIRHLDLLLLLETISCYHALPSAHGTFVVDSLPTHEKGHLGVFSDTEETMQLSL